ncbi:MAG TPA: hypothetical protein PK076_03595 [Saprospiraceae bacterium]|nr:hypothetical protein [Saprospiraceae bacterium]HQW55179.1 hypothetical protein [Saprospiraceae bacterium]
MKQVFIAIFLTLSTLAIAQSAKYEPAMKKALTQMDSAKTTADYQKAAALFERIGDAEKTQWLPYYYAASSLIVPAWTDAGIDKDKNAEKVNQLIEKAEAIEKNGDLYSLRYMVNTQQMVVNPQERFMTYGLKMQSAMSEGMRIDPNNPRLYYLQGSSLLNTPEQYGGGKAKAKVSLTKAMELFEKETPKPMYPHWGKDMTQKALDECNK